MFKRYGNYLIFPAILIIIFTLSAGLAIPREEQLIKGQLHTRTAVMQEFFSGNRSFESTKTTLAKVETGGLYDDDLLSMKNYTNSDMDKVRKMRILSIEKGIISLGYATYYAEILWYMEGSNGPYELVQEYHIASKQIGSGFKLSKFEPLIKKNV